eukprot:g7307.t1
MLYVDNSDGVCNDMPTAREHLDRFVALFAKLGIPLHDIFIDQLFRSLGWTKCTTLAKISRGGWLPLHKLASILGLFVHIGTVLFYMRYATGQFRLSYNALVLKQAPGGYVSHRATQAARWGMELLRRKDFRLPMADITRVGAFNMDTLVWEGDPGVLTALLSGVVRDELELKALVSTSGVPSAPAKELDNALASALEIAEAFQFNKIHIVTDCKAAHAGIKICYSREANLQEIIDKYTWELADKGISVSASAVSRDRLTVVDLLARGQVDAAARQWSASNPSARSLRAH